MSGKSTAYRRNTRKVLLNPSTMFNVLHYTENSKTMGVKYIPIPFQSSFRKAFRKQTGQETRT